MPDLLVLVRDGREIIADRSQLEALLKDGWNELGAQPTEGAEHGGEQHAGRPLDSELGPGEDGQESVDDPVGIE